SNLILKLKEFVFKLFSVKCQLTTLDLDISNDYDSIGIHTCFSLSSNRYLNLINNKLVTYCTSLRCLRIQLIYGVFLEQIIERVPSLEILSVQFACSLVKNWYLYEQQIKRFSPSVVNCEVHDNDELIYLKWIVNQMSYIEKLKIHLDLKKSKTINCVIDGHFVHKYCMPDILINLINFDFYIVSKCIFLLSTNDIEKIIDSFKTDRYVFND
ncbi:unnamed protein product, partial [Rotaria socialis]